MKIQMKRIVLISFIFIFSLVFTLSLVSSTLTISNTPSGTLVIPNHFASVNTTINSDNPLSYVQTNLSGTLTTIQDPSLVLSYNFDNQSALGENDTNVFDVSGNGNNGTVIGGSNISWTSQGKYNGAFNFSGNLSTIKSSNVNLTNGNFSFGIWVNQFSQSAESTLFDHANAYGNQLRATVKTTGVIRIIGANSTYSSVGLDKSSTTNILASITNSWNHIAVTYNGSAFAYYLNGNLINVVTYTGGIALYNNTPFYIGRAWDSSLKYNGSLDEFRFYNRTLSNAEVTSQYQTSCNKFNATRYNCYSNASNFTGLSGTFGLVVNDTSNNVNSSSTNILRKQNINLTSILIGSVNSYFYGSTTHRKELGEGVNISIGGASTNVSSNYSWLREQFISAKLKMGRVDMRLENLYSNQTTRTDGVNATGNFTSDITYIKWAYDNGIKINYIVDFMPTWLANTTSGYCTGTNSCTPNNYTIYNNILLDFLNRTTNSGQYISVIRLEFWNEPYGGFFLNSLSFDNLIKANEYVNFYNQTYNAVKLAYPNIQFGGASVARNAPNMTTTFLSNLTNRWDFVSYHSYAVNKFVGSTTFTTDISNFLNNCTLYSANCSSLALTEWNNQNSTLMNDSSFTNNQRVDISFALSSLLNNYPTITQNYYSFDERWKYSDTANYPSYPFLYAMVSEPQLDNAFYPPYNITYLFTRYAPSLATVYNSTTDYSDGIQVVNTKIGNTNNIIITNIENDLQNITINNLVSNSNLIDVSSGIIYTANSSGSLLYGVLNNYSVNSLSTPYFRDDNIYNYLNELIRPSTQNEISQYQAGGLPVSNTNNLCSDAISGPVSFFSGIGAVFVILGLGVILSIIGFVVFVVKSFGSVTRSESPDISSNIKLVGIVSISLFIVSLICIVGIIALSSLCSVITG